MKIKVKLAKMAMNSLPSTPTYDVTHPRSETVNHKDFINASEKEKRKILFEMARNHYIDDQNYPFDHFFDFFGFSLRKLLTGKKVLDLGCWCGGKTVSWAERWDVKSMHGVDVNKYFIEAAKLFSLQRKDRNINYKFNVGYGENLPYKNSTFDAIVSYDVFEHVQSLKKTITECKRVLKPGGMLFAVFPSYYMPTESHLGFVTRTPCIQWFFDSKTLQIAYNKIIESRGDGAYWYQPKEREIDVWKKLSGGIGINGTTIRDFRSIVKEVVFSKTYIFLPPLFFVGHTSIRHPSVKYISKILKPLLGINYLQDYLTHRIVSILIV